MISVELNESQKQAVEHSHGALLVIAGAGSGKTRVITARIAHLICNNHVDPRTIVALTFTNKAAREMKERLHSYVPELLAAPFVGTFHSYCLYLLRTYASFTQFDSFTLLDEDDSLSLIKKIMKQYGVEKTFSPSQARGLISSFKNNPHKNSFDSDKSSLLMDLYKQYEAEKRQAKVLDFDDLLVETVNLFSKNAEFKKLFQQKIRHILVDEYQDTNNLQHHFLKLMSMNDAGLALDSLCAVGDEDQAIYSWRGAVVANIELFKKEFAPVTLLKIEQNYRTVQPILDSANQVINNNKARNKKNLWSTKQATNRIIVLSARSDYHEAECLASFSKQCLSLSHKPTLAMLYRTHSQSRVLEEALIHRQIPYRIIGGIQFYQRKEIKDLLAYLRLIVNPHDRVSFFRALNCPPRGIGEKGAEFLTQYWNENPHYSFHALFEQLKIQEEHPFSGKKIETLIEFSALISSFKKEQAPSIVATSLLSQLEYLSYLHLHYDAEEFKTKSEIVKEFINALYYFENHTAQDASAEPRTVETLLHAITLMQEKEELSQKQETPSVLLMTLHAAKGLEFDYVLIPGLEEELFPSYNSAANQLALEEERRLFYVGMTRARERLIVSHAQRRSLFGQTTFQKPSRFIQELPSNLFQHLDAATVPNNFSDRYFNEWLTGVPMNAHLTFFSKNSSVQPRIKKVDEEKISFAQETKTKIINASFAKNTAQWHSSMMVSHPKFGIGMIKRVEPKDGETFYLTISFKKGEKKVLSQFVTKI